MRENTIFRDKFHDFVGRLRWLRIVKESNEGHGGPNHLSHAVIKTVISQKFQFIIFHDILLCNSCGKLRIKGTILSKLLFTRKKIAVISRFTPKNVPNHGLPEYPTSPSIAVFTSSCLAVFVPENCK